MRYWIRLKSFCIRKREKNRDYIPDTVVTSFFNAKEENQGTLLLEISEGAFGIHDRITRKAGIRLDRLDRVGKGEGALFFYLVIPCRGEKHPPFLEVEGKVGRQGELRTKRVHRLVWLGKWNYDGKAIMGKGGSDHKP